MVQSTSAVAANPIISGRNSTGVELFRLQDDGTLSQGPGGSVSTFTNTGDLRLSFDLYAGSATFTSGITASSGTFTASGGNQYSIVTTSGIQMNSGTLDINGGGGITNNYGIQTATLSISGAVTGLGNGLTISTGTTFTSSETVVGALGVGAVGLGNGTLVVQSTSAVAANPIISGRNSLGGELFRLQDDGTISHGPGGSVSTFTNTGDLRLSFGLYAGSATFTSGVTASSGTFTATGNTQYSLTTSSGILVNNGTLDVSGGGGITNNYGIQTATLDFIGAAADPASAYAGMFYYNSSSATMKMYNGTSWNWMFPHTVQTFAQTVQPAVPPIAGTSSAAKTIYVSPIYLSGPMVVNFMECYVGTVLGATGDIGIYSSTGGLVLNGGTGSLPVTATTLEKIAPVQTAASGLRFLPPGQYYAAVTWNSTTGTIGAVAVNAGSASTPTGWSATAGASVLPASIAISGITNKAFLYWVQLSQ